MPSPIWIACVIGILELVLMLPTGLLSVARAEERVIVGSKNFMENRLLGEIFAQLIEARTDLIVTRRFGLAGTQVCFEALRTGAIDLYPEYTGTGLLSILKEERAGGTRATLNRVRSVFLARWNLWWMSPLGFENAYALAMPEALADRLHITTISGLSAHAPQLTAGLGYEFVQRSDGLPGLRTVYNIRFAQVLPMQQALKYEAAASGDIDVLDVYTTDGRLLRDKLRVLEDDRGFFPPYEAAALIRGETLERAPAVGRVLGLLANAFDEPTMRHLNFRLQEEGARLEDVARDALMGLGLVKQPSHAETLTPPKTLVTYLWAHRGALGGRIAEHVGLAGVALSLGALLAIPLGLFLERRRSMAESIIRTIGITQTIPSIALLAFMIPLFGVGVFPAVVALWLYSLFPMVRNTYTGVRDAAPDAVEASRALGMTDRQILLLVRLPLAAPVIMAGVRTSGVLIIGTATLAAFIGAGGLGTFIVSGLQLADTHIILAGALPAALLALGVDALLGGVEWLVTPRGLGGPR